MTSLDKMLLRSFFKIFFIALVFFILILQLVDLFSNLWRYLNNDASIFGILQSLYFYVPKCIIYSIPPSLLFSISFTLGTYYTENQLISVFGSGISLFRFTLPLLITGILLSIFSFYFNDNVVIKYYKQKVKLTNILLGRTQSFSNTNVTVIGKNNCIYDADYYNDSSKTLSGLTVIIRNKKNIITQRIDCQWAVFKQGVWQMHKARVFTIDISSNSVTERYHELLTDKLVNEDTSTFKRKTRDMAELRIKEARVWLRSVRKAGLPVYRNSLTDYYERFSFTLTPFIVVLFSAAIGGRFKKNVLLLSLLSSLSFSVVYYVSQMIFVLFAKQGFIPPATGAWGTFFIFTAAGILLFRKART